MKTLLIAFAIFLPICALAAPDEAVVREMAAQTKLSPQEIRANYDACDSGVTLTMKICGSYRWIAQDLRLNRIYRQSMAQAKERGYDTTLVKAQRAWLGYRDAACSYEGEMGAGGGPMKGIAIWLSPNKNSPQCTQCVDQLKASQNITSLTPSPLPPAGEGRPAS